MLRLAVVEAPKDVYERLRRCANALGLEIAPARDGDGQPPDLVLVYGVVHDGRLRAVAQIPRAHLRVALADGPTTPAQAMAAGYDDVLHLSLPDSAIETLLGTMAERAALAAARKSHQPPPHAWAEHKLETLGSVVGGVAHDFNNLLTTVLANAKLLEPHLAGDEQVRQIQRIVRAARKAAHLTDELLVYAGRRQIEAAPVHVDGLLTEAVARLGSPVPAGIRLQIDVTPHLPPLHADADLLTNALVQLLNNALDACPDEKGTVRIRAGHIVLDQPPQGAFAARGAASGDYVFLQVADDGIGIAPDALPRVLDPFFTTKPHARGLGLATVLGIVRAHRGAIEIESTPGQGTLVRLLLPVSPPAAPAQSGANLPVVRDRPGVTVLVADDEPQLLATIERLLRNFDFEVATATSGQEAVTALARLQRAVHVVLYDLGLPDLAPTAALAALRATDPTVPIVFMSGMRSPEADAAIEADPRADFILKPFDPVALIRRLGEIARTNAP